MLVALLVNYPGFMEVYVPSWVAEKGYFLSLSSSIAASALVALIFLVVKATESWEMRSVSDSYHKQLLSVGDCMANLSSVIESGKLALDVPDLHSVFARHPTTEVSKAIKNVSYKDKLEIDALGLNLKSFIAEQIEAELLGEREVVARLLTQNPSSESLGSLCSREGRDPEKTRQSIHDTARAWRELSSNLNGRDIFRLKWSSKTPTITMVRVNNTIFVRPRLLQEVDEDLVYEVYQKKVNPKAFSLYLRQFEKEFEDAEEQQV
ncbi:hypothetical protein IT893_07385 [Thalassospira sp. A40-3]|uniref:hypothetical protein n=1 Tax=Thalassospira sp. A40-3 TaxID=2785908 RepID=UPI0018CD8B12|nr:hypothetical protein [Thalassospira sp. A40-3]QPO13320.1 hypothetical protein IT893_07385 [Thalassospira sp. A40-3]